MPHSPSASAAELLLPSLVFLMEEKSFLWLFKVPKIVLRHLFSTERVIAQCYLFSQHSLCTRSGLGRAGCFVLEICSAVGVLHPKQ